MTSTCRNLSCNSTTTPVRACVDAWTHGCVDACVRGCMRVRVCVHARACACVCACVRVRARACVCARYALLKLNHIVTLIACSKSYKIEYKVIITVTTITFLTL